MQEKLKLYVVTDSQVIGDRDFYQCIEDSLKGGATAIQLREKDALGKEFLEKATRLRELTRQYGALFFINDRVDIALLVDADGVHVGQKDIPADQVRKLIGPDKILGVSAKTVAEGQKAKADGADYIGVGAMFSTSTKLDADHVSREELVRIKEQVDLPIVAIGGLKLSNIGELAVYKPAGYAVISAILGAEDIEAETKKWSERV